MKNLRFKAVGRVGEARHLRLFRVMWERGVVGDGRGYSTKLAVGLCPRVFAYHRDSRYDAILVVLGLRVHYRRSYGGVFA